MLISGKGHATLFGEKTKKCLSFSVKGEKCRICSSAKLKGVPPRKHKCSCNWTGSAKSMEPALACEMIQSLNKEGTQVFNVLVYFFIKYEATKIQVN